MTGFDGFEFNYESPLMTKDGHGMVVDVFIKESKLIIDSYIDG
jgi:hypothetical protein